MLCRGTIVDSGQGNLFTWLVANTHRDSVSHVIAKDELIQIYIKETAIHAQSESSKRVHLNTFIAFEDTEISRPS